MQTGCSPERYLEPPQKKTKTEGKDGVQVAEHATVTDPAMSMRQTKAVYLDVPGGGDTILMPGGGSSIDVPGDNGPIEVPDGGGS